MLCIMCLNSLFYYAAIYYIIAIIIIIALMLLHISWRCRSQRFSSSIPTFISCIRSSDPPTCSRCWQQGCIHVIALSCGFFFLRSASSLHHAAHRRWSHLFLGCFSAADAGDQERHAGHHHHRIPLRLRGDVPVPPGASRPGQPRAAAQVSLGRRPGGGAPRRWPRRAGEHLGSDQGGQADM